MSTPSAPPTDQSVCTGICHHPWKKVQFEAKPAFGGLSHSFLSILMYLLEMLVVGTSAVIVNIDTYEKNRTKGSQTDKQTYQPNVQTNTSHTGMQDRKPLSHFKLLHFIEINPLKQNGWGHIWIMSIFSSCQHVTCCHRIMSCSACAVWKGFLKKKEHISETPRRSPCALEFTLINMCHSYSRHASWASNRALSRIICLFLWNS